MTKFYLELPSIERKEQAIEYINEFYENNSQIHGTGGLNSAFSATGMLIVVSVALEFDKQLEAQMLMKNSRGFLK